MSKKTELSTKIAEISKEVVKVGDEAKSLVIKSEEDMAGATTFLSGISARVKKIEELRKKFTEDLVKQKRTIDGEFKAQSQPLEEAIKIVKKAISTYALEQEEKARKQEEKEQAKLDKKREKAEAQGKEVDYAPAPTVDRRPTTVATSEGKMTTKKVWKFEVQDPNALPLAVRKMVLQRALQDGVIDKVIRPMVQNGEREIAGVRIYEDIDVSVRSLGGVA